MNHTHIRFAAFVFLLIALVFHQSFSVAQDADDNTIRVFIFGGQSNMVGADSKVEDIKNFPPFAGLDQPQKDVLFSYCIGRENKTRSNGWVNLQPIRNHVGPELSFARRVGQSIDAPIAIIKCAAGGTHLGGDWNPDKPTGFEMYPLAMELIKSSLKSLKDKGFKYRIEAVMWHQGENDMFNKEYMENYGKNLENFIACWRRDLDAPNLPFFIGELCTKTIWGMDLRPRMYAISQGQKSVTKKDKLATYVPTSHVGVEIGGGVGLHYHYGTLGQLQHGQNYAEAYLESIGKLKKTKRTLKSWPLKKDQPVRLFVLAGHRNMEGERAFADFLKDLKPAAHLANDNHAIPFKYSLGGGVVQSNGWEPLGLSGHYDNFGPELSFAEHLRLANFAIAKFTHSGSQIIDWTPDGSMAKDRMLYQSFIKFTREAIRDLKEKGHEVELAGIVYHVGENDMSFFPYRKESAARVQALISQSRIDLGLNDLKWFVSQQPPTDDKRVNSFDVVSAFEKTFAKDEHTVHVKVFDIPKQSKKLVLDTNGVLHLGRKLAEAVSKTMPEQESNSAARAPGKPLEQEIPEAIRKAIAVGQIEISLKPGEIENSKFRIPWSPKGTKVPLKRKGEWLLGQVKVGVHQPINVRFRFNDKTSELGIDTNADGKFSESETSLAKAAPPRKGKTWHSHSATLVLRDRQKHTLNYPVSFWYVDDPEGNDDPVIRWSRKGWHEGEFKLNGKTAYVLITDADGDGLFSGRDSWGAAFSKEDLFKYENCAFKIASHAWLGEEIPIEITRFDPWGESIEIRAFDLGQTRAEEREQKDPYREDKKFARAKKPVHFEKSYEQAIKRAQAEGKPILIDFVTDWCGPCRSMEKFVFTAKPVADLESKTIFLKLDGDAEKELVKKYSVNAYPTLILIDANGKVLNRARGYVGVKQLLLLLNDKP